MGTTKQLLPVSGKPMVRLVTEAACAAGLEQVIVVVGADSEAVAGALDGLPVEIKVNDSWELGLSTSVQAGVESLRRDVQAVMFILGDQPGLSYKLLRSLVDRYRATRSPIVAPVFQGNRANPVLFDRSLWPEFMAAENDEGGRSVIARHAGEVELVEVEDQATVADVDTREDYANALAASPRVHMAKPGHHD